MKTEPILLGRNDYPAKEKSDYVESSVVPGMQAVKSDTVAHNNGTRTGRNERRSV